MTEAPPAIPPDGTFAVYFLHDVEHHVRDIHDKRRRTSTESV